MGNGFNLKILINKLEERGVLSNQRAKTLRRLVKQLDTPTAKAIRLMVIKAIADIILDSINNR